MKVWLRSKRQAADVQSPLAAIEQRLADLERRLLRQEEEAAKVATGLFERLEILHRKEANHR